MVSEKVRRVLEKQHYGIVGEHSGLQVCRWTKKALLGEGQCYKADFYGIESHRCCQMSPAVNFCQNFCLHCWRAVELTEGMRMGKVDGPREIIEGCVSEQKRLLSGFLGNPKVRLRRFGEAQEPKHFAISLSGEPMIYSRIGEMIELLRDRKKTSFLVTNGLMPERVKELERAGQLPTQLYVSLNAPNSQIFKEITRSKLKDAWKKFSETLELLSGLRTRRVLRLTLVRDLNMGWEEEYAKLIARARPDWVEVKGFMSVGFARQRLGYDRMPLHGEVKEFARKLAGEIGLKVLDEKKESRVVLLGKGKKRLKI